jgi:hypothetical protein
MMARRSVDYLAERISRSREFPNRNSASDTCRGKVFRGCNFSFITLALYFAETPLYRQHYSTLYYTGLLFKCHDFQIFILVHYENSDQPICFAPNSCSASSSPVLDGHYIHTSYRFSSSAYYRVSSIA